MATLGALRNPCTVYCNLSHPRLQSARPLLIARIRAEFNFFAEDRATASAQDDEECGT